jgi:Ras family protein T1
VCVVTDLRNPYNQLPVILCANKSDLYPDVEAEKEMMPIMLEFKEIDSCIRASAKELKNINEVCYIMIIRS